MTRTFPNHILKSALALALAVVFALGAATPRAAKADPGEAIAAGIIGLAIYCGATGKCDSTQQRATSGGGGIADAKALNRKEAMWVQGGLKNLGFYRGPIDGAIGAGTRASIRAYQAAIGAPQTGVLTGVQINDLVALSPEFARYGSGSPKMFRADRANDLDRDGVRQLQAALNREGFNAGAVDGSFGAGTANAVQRYMAAKDLPGNPVASRRLLARLMGWAPPEPAGAHLVAQRSPTTGPADAGSQRKIETSALPATPAPAMGGGYDILGVTLGMSEPEAKAALMAGLGGSLLFDTADAPALGAQGAVSRGFLAVQPDWPAAPSEQVMVLFDDARPELGALAVFRLIRMPDGVDAAAFNTDVLPDIVANYGGDGLVPGADRWVGNAAQREMSPDGAACGDMTLAVDPGSDNALAALWRSGGGPRFVGGGPASVAASCGEVLDVAFADHVVRIGLWNASALAGAEAAGAVPKIKF